MAQKTDLAPGFRFYPSDRELITYYLKPHILGQKLLCDIVKHVELYGPNSTPWKLFDVEDEDSWTDYPDKESEKYVFVFTTLSKLRCLESNKGRIRENTCKKAGCGTWDAKTKKKPIKDRNGKVIGEQRMLLFKIDDIGDGFDLSKAGHFRMHEYSLAGVNKGIKSAGGNDVVLCRITYNSSKTPVFNMGSKISDHGSREQNKNENKNEKNVRSIRDDLEGNGNSTSTSVVEMTSGGNRVEASENFHNGSEEIGSEEFNENVWDPSFTDWLTDLLNSDQEEEAVEDFSKLGKRKFEEESFCGSKKMCL